MVGRVGAIPQCNRYFNASFALYRDEGRKGINALQQRADRFWERIRLPDRRGKEGGPGGYIRWTISRAGIEVMEDFVAAAECSRCPSEKAMVELGLVQKERLGAVEAPTNRASHRTCVRRRYLAANVPPARCCLLSTSSLLWRPVFCCDVVEFSEFVRMQAHGVPVCGQIRCVPAIERAHV